MLLEERINVFDAKKAREICKKYAQLPNTPYSKCRYTKRDDCLRQAAETLPEALNEIERLQSEGGKLIKLLANQADKAENFRRKNDELEAENERLQKKIKKMHRSLCIESEEAK